MGNEFRRLLHGHLFPKYDSFRVAAADLGIAPSTLEAMCAGRRPPARIDLDWLTFKLGIVGDDKKLFVLTGLIAKAPAEIREIFFDHFEKILRDYSCPEFLVFDYRQLPEERGKLHYKSYKTRGNVELPDGRVISSKEGRKMF